MHVGGGKYRYVHRVVMERELGRPLRSDEYVHHIDDNPQNNALDNLVLMTAEEHFHYTGCESARRRERRTYTNAELTEIQASGVKAAYETFPDRPLSAIARDFRVSEQMIADVIKGRRFVGATSDLRSLRRPRQYVALAEVLDATA